jgi:peptidoglycan/xylan/chitin deacetylase (PgdA/CDA1 family)
VLDRRLETTGGPLANRSRRTAFLCYHSVHPAGPKYLSVTPEAFEDHLRVLRRGGYRAGTVEDLFTLARGGRPTERLAFLSFDDGFLDTHTYAWPLLRRHGLTGATFLVSGSVEAPALDWPDITPDAPRYPDVMRPLSWAMVEEMAAHGMEFGSHTRSHAHLTRLSDEELRQELFDSRAAVAERIGRCDTLAYPFGEWDLRVALAAAAAGYAFAFALPPTRSGLTTALSVPRLSVDHRDGARRFALKLSPVFRALAFTGAVHSLRLLRIRAREALQG